ncbi:MAG: glycosyltransferase family 2 protein, partial [Proteobacteria bacterium]|nr:glycosyltransferase family 2 protein [Pseudomonadota bacterium]
AVRLLISQMPDDYPEPEVLAVLGRHGMKVREFNVSMAKRSAGSSSLDPLKSALYMIKVATALLASAARSFTLQLFNRG